MQFIEEEDGWGASSCAAKRFCGIKRLVYGSGWVPFNYPSTDRALGLKSSALPQQRHILESHKGRVTFLIVAVLHSSQGSLQHEPP